MEKAAGTGQTRRIWCFSTRFGGSDGAILRERGCFVRERQVQGAEKCGTIKMQGGSVAMELRIAIVEDQKFEAQQLKTQENFLVCNRGLLLNMDKVLRFEGDCIEMLDGARLPVRLKDKNNLFAQFTQDQFRHMQREF